MSDQSQAGESVPSIEPSSTLIVQRLLDRLKSGEVDASKQLLDVSMNRLRQLSKKILADIPGVSRWEEADDLLQNASIRLWRALEKNHPATPLDYFRLAAAVIRRELVDLSRRYFGPHGMAANLARSWVNHMVSTKEPAHFSPEDETYEPQKLGRWTEFHEYIEKLPEAERVLFDLLWYQGLTIGEAAELICESERTTRRRWKAVRISLYRALLDDSSQV